MTNWFIQRSRAYGTTAVGISDVLGGFDQSVGGSGQRKTNLRIIKVTWTLPGQARVLFPIFGAILVLYVAATLVLVSHAPGSQSIQTRSAPAALDLFP